MMVSRATLVRWLNQLSTPTDAWRYIATRTTNNLKRCTAFPSLSHDTPPAYNIWAAMTPWKMRDHKNCSVMYCVLQVSYQHTHTSKWNARSWFRYTCVFLNERWYVCLRTTFCAYFVLVTVSLVVGISEIDCRDRLVLRHYQLCVAWGR